MANFYSLDLRKRVVNHVLSGNQIAATSRLFQVGRKTIYRWLHLLKVQSHLNSKQPNPRKGYKINHEAVSNHFVQSADATLQEVADAFSTHPSAIWYVCQKQKITRKKRLLTTRSVMNKRGKNL